MSIRERRMKCITGLFLLNFLVFSLTGTTTAGMVILTEDLPPFNHIEKGKLTGATTQVVQEIIRRLGIDDPIECLPWARGYKRLRNEPNVVLFTTVLTKEREPLFHWVGPLFASRLDFFARKSDPRRIDSLETAKQVGAIATYRDDSGEQILKSLGFTNLDSSNSPQGNIRKLVSGRVDLWFFHNNGVTRIARKAGIDPHEIKTVFTYKQYFSYIAISKQTSSAIVHQWQATLNEMKSDSTFW